MVTRRYRLLGAWLLVAATVACGTPLSGTPGEPDTKPPLWSRMVLAQRMSQ